MENMDKEVYSRPGSTVTDRCSSTVVNQLHHQPVDTATENSKIEAELKNNTETRLPTDDIVDVSATISKASSVSNLSDISSNSSVVSRILCTPCFRANSNVAAVKYCVVCAENLCKPCLRKHIKSNASKQHKLIGPEETEDFLQTSLDAIRTGIEKCPKHGDLDLNNFCEQHKVLCCDKCAYLEHG